MASATKAANTLVAAGTVQAAGTVTTGTTTTVTTRGVLGVQTGLGGIVTYKITNGATGPTLQCEARILIAHNSVTPAAASAGADWKTVSVVGNGVAANAVNEWSYEFGMGVMAIEIEFTGNTGQAVTVEAFVSTVPSVA
jgi:hypothetical protein